MAAVAYLRVSTEDQELGVEAQKRAIRQWAKSRNLEVKSWHVDHGISGGAPLDKRPALMEAIDEVEQGDVLVVARWDRLARDTLAAAMIERLVERKGGRIEAADGSGCGDGPEAVLMRRLLMAFAEYERAILRARTRAALQAKKARGERVGKIPYGYRLGDNGKLEPEPREQAVVRVMVELWRRGLSYSAIARELERRGAPSRTGRWTHPTIKKIIDRVLAEERKAA